MRSTAVINVDKKTPTVWPSCRLVCRNTWFLFRDFYMQMSAQAKTNLEKISRERQSTRIGPLDEAKLAQLYSPSIPDALFDITTFYQNLLPSMKCHLPR